MHHYEYLVYSLIFVSIFLLAFYTRKDLRPHLIIPLIIGAVAGPLSEFVYFRDYWKPVTILGKGIPSFEDVFFGAAIVGLALVCYPIIANKRERKKKPHIHKALMLALEGMLTLTLLLLMGVNSIIASAIVFISIWLIIIIADPKILKPSLISAIAIASLAGAVYFVLLSFFYKTLLQDWWLIAHTSLGVVLPGNIPLTEVLWFFTAAGFLESLDVYAEGIIFARPKRKKS